MTKPMEYLHVFRGEIIPRIDFFTELKKQSLIKPFCLKSFNPYCPSKLLRIKWGDEWIVLYIYEWITFGVSSQLECRNPTTLFGSIVSGHRAAAGQYFGCLDLLLYQNRLNYSLSLFSVWRGKIVSTRRSWLNKRSVMKVRKLLEIVIVSMFQVRHLCVCH